MELDIKSSTAEKLIDIGNDFLQKFAGPSAIEQGLIWEDNQKLRRLQNQIRNFEIVKGIVAKGNIKLKQINLKALFPYLQGVSLEEDEELQVLWANLFVNYIDANKNLLINVYPSILGQISTPEVKILKYLEDTRKLLITNYRKPPEQVDFEYELLANLERLGLIEQELKVNKPQIRYDEIDPIEPYPSGNYYITDFGQQLLIACQR